MPELFYERMEAMFKELEIELEDTQKEPIIIE